MLFFAQCEQEVFCVLRMFQSGTTGDERMCNGFPVMAVDGNADAFRPKLQCYVCHRQFLADVVITDIATLLRGGLPTQPAE